MSLPLSGSCRDQMVIGEAQAVESREPASLREWWVGRSFEPVQGERETAGYLPGQTLDSYEWLLREQGNSRICGICSAEPGVPRPLWRQ